MSNELLGNKQAQTELARDIGAYFAGQRLGPDAEIVPMPERPSVAGLKPEAAAKALSEHEAKEKAYMDYLLRRPGTLSAQEQAFLARHIRVWSESGRKDD